MNFNKLDQMRSIIASRNTISEKTFNGYSIHDDFLKYQRYLYDCFEEFQKEQQLNFNNTQEITEQDFINLFYRFNRWKAIVRYTYEQWKTIEGEYKDIIKSIDTDAFKKFQFEKHRYAIKTRNFLKGAIESITQGIKEYKKVKTKAKYSTSLKRAERISNNVPFFNWKHSNPDSRHILYTFLIKNFFISSDTRENDFTKIFIFNIVPPIDTLGKQKVKWIDTSKRRNQYNRKSLVYLIQGLIESNIIEGFKNNKDRNDAIFYHFADPKGNPIQNLGNMSGNAQPGRAESIDEIINIINET